ncbi:hypothetical protein NP493_226g08001 [Ridgeia piscesae]|uniref:G-protein coupled receptors family 1 profile domain-containing protein n=1 Tax=Ridgeia piscesae TaxID=27915 RepID=A0AAD9UDV9_RIDPI|nr:hypothetical protein NP493_226g08001 [Ridgeia piscesae]
MTSTSYSFAANGSDDIFLPVNMIGNGSVTLNTTVAPVKAPYDTQLAMFRFVCEVCISMPIAIVGIITNVVAFLVLATQKHRLTTTVLLQALAVADTLVLVCSLLIRSLVTLHTLTASLGAYINVYPQVFVPNEYGHLCLNCAVYLQAQMYEYVLKTWYSMTSLTRNHVYVVVYRIVIFSTCMYLVPMVTLVVLNWHLRNFRSGLTSGTRRCRAVYWRPSKMRSDRECRSML